MFVSICNKEYLVGYEVMLKSLTDTNPRVMNENIPFYLISNDLTDEDLIVSKKIHSNITLMNYNTEKYEKLKKLQEGQVAFGDYSKYEIFSLDFLDKIIFLDTDIVVLGNIDHLIDFKEDFGAVKELYIDQYNTGVMVIGKKYLNKEVTDHLIHLTTIYGITEHLDQDITDHYFSDIITPLPIEYNYLKTYSKQIFQNTGLPKCLKILHFIVKKPWQNKPLVFLEEGTIWQEKYWFDVYSKILKLK